MHKNNNIVSMTNFIRIQLTSNPALPPPALYSLTSGWGLRAGLINRLGTGEHQGSHSSGGEDAADGSCRSPTSKCGSGTPGSKLAGSPEIKGQLPSVASCVLEVPSFQSWLSRKGLMCNFCVLGKKTKYLRWQLA